MAMMILVQTMKNCLAVFALVCIMPSLAHAHGMDAAVMAPPLILSGLLAFMCYWLVILWPVSKKESAGSNGYGPAQPSGDSQTIRIKRKPRLRVIEATRQREDGQPETRRAG
jgi:hypothetical protein